MVTDKQVRKLFRLKAAGMPLTRCALLTDMDEKTARKYLNLGQLPGELAKPHTWRTRPNPFADVWSEVSALLEVNPGLQAKTLFQELQRRYPGRFADGQLRTLQRHIRRWRAEVGPPKEVFFAQVHEPGRLGASDFTHMSDLGVTIQGQPFAHLVYHFVLTYSNWETATICFSESLESLSEGLQNALWELGGVPRRHRTDRMSTAVNNLTDGKEFTGRYQALLGHYGLAGEKIQADHAHENGDVEQRHRRFKEAIDQALMLRGSRDFAAREAYAQFLCQVLEQLNAGRRVRLAEEVAALRPLPARRLEACQRLRVKVDQGSLIHVGRNSYSVPSRLIGEQVEVRLFVEHLEVWYVQQRVEVLPRLRGRDKQCINYRHIIDWLVRKPGAFAQYRYRQELFPSSIFRLAYDSLVSLQTSTADKEYLRILYLAARHSEAAVEDVLRRLLGQGPPVSAAAVEQALGVGVPRPVIPEVCVEAVDLRCFDALFTEKEVTDGHGSGRERTAGEAVAGAAFADGAGELRRVGAAGGAGDAQLRALPVGAVRAGEPGAAGEADRAAAAGVVLAFGEEPGDVRPEALAGEGGAPDSESARRRLCGSQGEPFGVWQTRFGEDAPPLWPGPGVGAGGAAGVLHDLQPAGAEPAGGQTRPEAVAGAEAAGEVRGAADRRPGVRAAVAGGDGGAVHALGGAVRTGERVADEQPAVLAMGADLPGPDDDSGGDRPAGASQHHCGIEPAQLPAGTSEEDQGGRDGVIRSAQRDRARSGRRSRRPGNPGPFKES
jgi:transposase